MNDFKKLKARYRNKSVRPATEVPVETYLFRKVRAVGFRAVKYEDPSFDGGPDRLILGPGAFVEFVETKSDEGKLSPAQKFYHKGLIESGYKVHVIRDRAGVDRYIKYLKRVKSAESLGL